MVYQFHNTQRVIFHLKEKNTQYPDQTEIANFFLNKVSLNTYLSNKDQIGSCDPHIYATSIHRRE
jgi:hypothetical protein